MMKIHVFFLYLLLTSELLIKKAAGFGNNSWEKILFFDFCYKKDTDLTLGK